MSIFRQNLKMTGTKKTNFKSKKVSKIRKKRVATWGVIGESPIKITPKMDKNKKLRQSIKPL